MALSQWGRRGKDLACLCVINYSSTPKDSYTQYASIGSRFKTSSPAHVLVWLLALRRTKIECYVLKRFSVVENGFLSCTGGTGAKGEREGEKKTQGKRRKNYKVKTEMIRLREGLREGQRQNEIKINQEKKNKKKNEEREKKKK